MNPLDRPPAVVIQVGKAKSEMLARAVVQGCSGRGVILHAPESVPPDHMPVFIGLHPTTAPLLIGCAQRREPFVYIDNGYFRPYKQGGYFRATTNALQWFYRETPDPERARLRFVALDIEPQPWRAGGSEIMVALQTPAWFHMLGRDREQWLDAVLKDVWFRTSMRVVVREKPLKGARPSEPVEAALERAWAVAGFSSNVMIQAAARGIQVHPLAVCAASPLGSSSFEGVDRHDGRPHRHWEQKRLEVFEALAAAQWTADEISRGVMWGHLSEAYEPEFKPLA